MLAFTDDEWELVTCYCLKPFAGRPMIECSECSTWIHLSCAKIRKNNVPDVFTCQRCRDSKFDIRRSNRAREPKKQFKELYEELWTPNKRTCTAVAKYIIMFCTNRPQYERTTLLRVGDVVSLNSSWPERAAVNDSAFVSSGGFGPTFSELVFVKMQRGSLS